MLSQSPDSHEERARLGRGVLLDDALGLSREDERGVIHLIRAGRRLHGAIVTAQAAWIRAAQNVLEVADSRGFLWFRVVPVPRLAGLSGLARGATPFRVRSAEVSDLPLKGVGTLVPNNGAGAAAEAARRWRGGVGGWGPAVAPERRDDVATRVGKISVGTRAKGAALHVLGVRVVVFSPDWVDASQRGERVVDQKRRNREERGQNQRCNVTHM